MIKKKQFSFVEAIDEDGIECEEGMYDGGFNEKIHGRVISSFNFNETKAPASLPAAAPREQTNEVKAAAEVSLADNRKLKTCPNGVTPLVNGEAFDISRSYKIRRSTAKMLNELKAAHPDVNVYMNTIVDAALRHYYNYIFHENGIQDDLVELS